MGTIVNSLMPQAMVNIDHPQASQNGTLRCTTNCLFIAHIQESQLFGWAKFLRRTGLKNQIRRDFLYCL